jgi:thiamine biosynthesis protein ThiS
MSKITITINGQETLINKDSTINSLIHKYELDITKIAIEKDLQIVNPSDFDKIILDNGCKIEIVHFIGGG